MSTLDLCGSSPNHEVLQLRKQAAYKDNAYSTLENELFKMNNDMAAMKFALDDALNKLRNEADRALKLEVELDQRSEDLRAERLTCQNLETSLRSVSEKAKAEELKSKRLEMELETYLSRVSCQQDQVKHLDHEKTMLEIRVRTLESQSQSNTPSHPQHPAMVPSESDDRIPALESELAEVKHELGEVSQSFSHAQQEVVKLRRLQAKLISAENGQMRAERLANTEKTRADQLQDALRERDDELEYWRGASEKSALESMIEELKRERDDALRREGDIRWREAATRRRMEELEAREAGLVTEREQALDALHQLQMESNSTSEQVGDDSTDFPAALVGCDVQRTRESIVELYQVSHDTIAACDLKRLHETAKPHAPPLIIVTPPPSPLPVSPFLGQAQPSSTMSAADEAVVVRLLNAIERLRSERDDLRRNFHFTQVEHRMITEALQTQLTAAENNVHRVVTTSKSRQDDVRIGHEVDMQEPKGQSGRGHQEAGGTCDEEPKPAELRARKMEDTCIRPIWTTAGDIKRTSAFHAKDSRFALALLLVIKHLHSSLDVIEMENETLCSELIQVRDRLIGACGQADAPSGTIEAHDAHFIRQSLEEALTATEVCLSESLQAAEAHDRIQAQLAELQSYHSILEQELADAKAELCAVEVRYSKQQRPDLVSTDSETANNLNLQLEVLEQRVLRRTEQIGMQQHDIKRLETNLHVAEDTIGELTIEIETLNRDKLCLVEDCAQAREARDEANRRIEILEVELETFIKDQEKLSETRVSLQDAHAEITAGERCIETLVHVIADFATRSKAVNLELTHTATRLCTIEADFNVAEASHARSRAEVSHLTSELDTKTLALDTTAAQVEALKHELLLAEEETHRISVAFESLKHQVQSPEKDAFTQTDHPNTTVDEFQARLEITQPSEEALFEQLKLARDAEMALKFQLATVQENLSAVTAEAGRLTLTVTKVTEALEAERVAHFQELERARQDLEIQVVELEAKLEQCQIQQAALQADQARVVQEFTTKNEELQARLVRAQAKVKCSELLESDFRRLKGEHVEETVNLRSQLADSTNHIQSLHEQLETAACTVQNLKSDLEKSIQSFKAAQMEVHSHKHTLAGARTQLDEHDASIQALQREKTMLQRAHMQLEAELEKSTTKYQYLEQQARRSDLEVIRLKGDLESLHAEAVKSDEAAQKAELSLSFKTVQFEQKLAIMQRELKKQQEHHQCQESLAELKEKNEYLEELLRMKSAEIEENDDRFIETLKEKKRLSGKVESLTRKIHSLQTKLATATPTSTSIPASHQNTHSPVILQLIPSVEPSARPATRIPNSPGVVLRAKTPEPVQKQFTSRFATPEPPVPLMLQTSKIKTPERASIIMRGVPKMESTSPATSSTPLPSSRKRRAPEDFDSPAPVTTEVVVGTSFNLTPRHLGRAPLNEGRIRFTPTRGGAVPTRTIPTQNTPSRRITAPLSEMTNSPKKNRKFGFEKLTAASKPPIRSWLSRSRPPTGGADLRCTSTPGARP